MKTTTTPVGEKLLTLDEARGILSCSRQSLYNWNSDGSLEMVKLGRRTLIRSSELDRFVAALPRRRGQS